MSVKSYQQRNQQVSLIHPLGERAHVVCTCVSMPVSTCVRVFVIACVWKG